jgi:hypothetical protein
LSSFELTKKSASLARAAPREWQEFLTEFSNYVRSQKDALVYAPPEKIALTQGMVQQVVTLEGIFATCVQDHDKVQSKIDKRTYPKS